MNPDSFESSYQSPFLIYSVLAYGGGIDPSVVYSSTSELLAEAECKRLISVLGETERKFKVSVCHLAEGPPAP